MAMITVISVDSPSSRTVFGSFCNTMVDTGSLSL